MMAPVPPPPPTPSVATDSFDHSQGRRQTRSDEPDAFSPVLARARSGAPGQRASEPEAAADRASDSRGIDRGVTERSTNRPAHRAVEDHAADGESSRPDQGLDPAATAQQDGDQAALAADLNTPAPSGEAMAATDDATAQPGQTADGEVAATSTASGRLHDQGVDVAGPRISESSTVGTQDGLVQTPTSTDDTAAGEEASGDRAASGSPTGFEDPSTRTETSTDVDPPQAATSNQSTARADADPGAVGESAVVPAVQVTSGDLADGASAGPDGAGQAAGADTRGAASAASGPQPVVQVPTDAQAESVELADAAESSAGRLVGASPNESGRGGILDTTADVDVAVERLPGVAPSNSGAQPAAADGPTIDEAAPAPAPASGPALAGSDRSSNDVSSRGLMPLGNAPVEQSQTAVTAGTSTPATAELSDEATAELWGQVQRALNRARSGPAGSELRLRLRPAELGDLLVQVRNVGDQLSVRLVTSSLSAQQVLQNDQPRLAAELAAAGFDDGSFDISHRGQPDSGAGSGSDQRAGSDRRPSGGDVVPTSPSAVAARLDQSIDTPGTRRQRGSVELKL